MDSSPQLSVLLVCETLENPRWTNFYSMQTDRLRWVRSPCYAQAFLPALFRFRHCNIESQNFCCYAVVDVHQTTKWRWECQFRKEKKSTLVLFFGSFELLPKRPLWILCVGLWFLQFTWGRGLSALNEGWSEENLPRTTSIVSNTTVSEGIFFQLDQRCGIVRLNAWWFVRDAGIFVSVISVTFSFGFMVYSRSIAPNDGRWHLKSYQAFNAKTSRPDSSLNIWLRLVQRGQLLLYRRVRPSS